jgi:hypothetical protein
VLLAAEGIALHRVRRAWDETTWPLATRGFFAFAAKIPALLRDADLVPGAEVR